MVFLENWFGLLLIFHLLITFILVGSMTHQLFVVRDYLRGKFGMQKRDFYYLKVVLWSYLICYVIGALIYPAFRIHVRHEYFDVLTNNIRWATGLFEVKEHWGAVLMALLLALYCLRRSFQPSEEKAKLYFYLPMLLVVNLTVWYKVIVGVYLTSLKGSW